MVWGRSYPAASLPVPSVKPPTLLSEVSCMISLLPLKEWLLLNVKEGPCLSTPTSGPELRPRPCGGPCALEKGHHRTQQ